MKKTIFISAFLLFFNLFTYAQVGINTDTPNADLDVNGDINLTGMLKTNNVSGVEGQVLQVATGGQIGWVNLCDYKNFKQFKKQAADTLHWTIPLGVHKLYVELWGGGGAGNTGGGGGSTGYNSAVISVTPGVIIDLVIGTGGEFGGELATNSQIIIWPGKIWATHGHAASTTKGGSGGYGGYCYPSLSVVSMMRAGSDGKNTKITYAQETSTSYVTVNDYGGGADSYLYPDSGGLGGHAVKRADGSVLHYTLAQEGQYPGGGGGGDRINSKDGGDGMIIIHY